MTTVCESHDIPYSTLSSGTLIFVRDFNGHTFIITQCDLMINSKFFIELRRNKLTLKTISHYFPLATTTTPTDLIMKIS